MKRVLLAGIVVGAACGGTTTPRPPPAEVAIEDPASFAGSWVTDGQLDWYYTLTLTPDGRLALVIDRGKMGSCEQKGRLQPADDPRTYQLVYEKNTCTPEAGGGPFRVHVESFTGTTLTLAIGDGDAAERRTYGRDPKVAAP